MKRVLLIALMACGLVFVPAQHSDAQVSVGIGGVGVGFGYPAYRYGYYPYGYYQTYPVPMAITGDPEYTGTTDIESTATIGIIITIATNLA